jgi:hypothetical protein
VRELQQAQAVAVVVSLAMYLQVEQVAELPIRVTLAELGLQRAVLIQVAAVVVAVQLVVMDKTRMFAEMAVAALQAQ